MSKSLFLTYDSKVQIAYTIDNLIIAKKLHDAGCCLPEDTNFLGSSNGDSLFDKGVSFLFDGAEFNYLDDPTEDATHFLEFRYAFYLQSPLVKKWHDLLRFFGDNDEIQQLHTEFESWIAEKWCDDYVEMFVEGKLLPDGLRVTVFGFDGYFHEIFEEYIGLRYQLEEAVREWSIRRDTEEEKCDDEVA